MMTDYAGNLLLLKFLPTTNQCKMSPNCFYMQYFQRAAQTLLVYFSNKNLTQTMKINLRQAKVQCTNNRYGLES